MTQAIEIIKFLKDFSSDNRIPGIACAVTRNAERLGEYYVGHQTHLVDSECVSRETYFDLASLTKVTTTLQWLLKLVSKDTNVLQIRVGDVFCDAASWLAMVPVWRLANHTSGLSAHVLFPTAISQHGNSDIPQTKESQHAVRTYILNSKPHYPTGTRQVYSDLGFILLAEMLSKIDRPMSDALVNLFGHGPHKLHWCPSNPDQPTTPQKAYAATENCPWRKQLLRGQVHDDNCWFLGGLHGHAGIFGRLQDVHDLMREWSMCLAGAPHKLEIDSAIARASLSSSYRHKDGSHALGWDTPSPLGSSTGTGFDSTSFGHLGFTGTSVWVDPTDGLIVTLLTNRVCPDRTNLSIRQLRPKLHNLVRRYYPR